MGDSDDDEEVEREYRRNKHKYEAEEEEDADNGDADEVAEQEIFDFDSDIAVLKARWMGERDEVTQSINHTLVSLLITSRHLCASLHASGLKSYTTQC